MRLLNTYRSPNYNERPKAPDMLLLHYTGMRTAEDALRRLCSPQAAVSAHYVVDEDGLAYALVDEDKRAWHAGLSFWQGERDINGCSVGIEIVNPGHEFGYRPFPERQIESVCALALEIIERHGIRAGRVLGHSDVAPKRKQDPGELFPWKTLADRGVGLWSSRFEPLAGSRRAMLSLVGYDVSDEDAALRAFQRHFYPEAFGRAAGEDRTEERLSAVASLLREERMKL